MVYTAELATVVLAVFEVFDNLVLEVGKPSVWI
jgi:hypothetical protein